MNQEPSSRRAVIADAREGIPALAGPGGRQEAQQQPETQAAHSCRNCEGIDPDTCWTNPDRPPEQCPAAEFEDYGQQCQKPVGYELHTFEGPPAVVSAVPPQPEETSRG